MKEKESDVYIGGERDPEAKILPKYYGRFFNRKWLFLTLFVLVIMLLIGGAGF